MNKEYSFLYTDEYGASLRVNDEEYADEINDFLVEKCYVYFSQKFTDEYVEFYFGQASNVESVRRLMKRFEGEKGQPLDLSKTSTPRGAEGGSGSESSNP